MNKKPITKIINEIKTRRNLDFSGYRFNMLDRRIQKRVRTLNCKNHKEYLSYIEQNDYELDKLIQTLTIKVSHFFRNPIYFEFMGRFVIPALIPQIEKSNSTSLRIWSAGCSKGEEPYSMAILAKETLKKNKQKIQPKIFATDIDINALEEAQLGRYDTKSVEHMKLGLLLRYFKKSNNQYQITDEIKELVQFSFYNLLDKKSFVPPTSIFGEFDIVLCRNVLIYFNVEFQKTIFNKLYKSLKKNGFLILGEAESIPKEFKEKFRPVNNYCKIYEKIDLPDE